MAFNDLPFRGRFVVVFGWPAPSLELEAAREILAEVFVCRAAGLIEMTCGRAEAETHGEEGLCLVSSEWMDKAHHITMRIPSQPLQKYWADLLRTLLVANGDSFSKK